MSYGYLYKIKSPRIIAEAMNLYGVKEIKGNQHNPVILGWAKELGVDNIYKADETPWCGLFMAIVVKRAEYEPVKNFLRALSWKSFGTEQKTAMLGDILVFKREGGGHVGIYVAEDKECYHVLGGNQGDAVSIVRILKSRCVAIRRCPWKIKQPDTVTRIFLSPTGNISVNEA
jgi:uncharacterized protein (TIGR02594 family)